MCREVSLGLKGQPTSPLRLLSTLHTHLPGRTHLRSPMFVSVANGRFLIQHLFFFFFVFMLGLVVSPALSCSEWPDTVVSTIHQPSSAMFMMFDRVTLLAGWSTSGSTVYGSAPWAPSCVGCFPLLRYFNQNGQLVSHLCSRGEVTFSTPILAFNLPLPNKQQLI